MVTGKKTIEAQILKWLTAMDDYAREGICRCKAIQKYLTDNVEFVNAKSSFRYSNSRLHTVWRNVATTLYDILHTIDL